MDLGEVFRLKDDTSVIVVFKGLMKVKKSFVFAINLKTYIAQGKMG